MKLVQVYDPSMCCSSGVCGPDVDPVLPRFAGLLAQLGAAGIKIERFNLAHQPLPFARNPAVKTLLNSEGPSALPAIFIDGELVLKGRYPEISERAAWIGRSREHTAAT
jgi:hypothetical protein